MKRLSLFVIAVMVVGMLNAHVAYLLPGDAATWTDIPAESATVNEFLYQENAELNAAMWFNTNYVATGKGVFITMAQLSAGVPDTIQAIWINVDRVGADMPALGFSDAIVEVLSEYAHSGGNLYLTKQATGLAYRIGRIGYAPGFTANGYMMGAEGDFWAINPILGADPNIETIDRSDDPLFEGLSVDSLRFGWKTYPMVHDGVRTDNNCLWMDLYRKDINTGGAMAETEGYTHYRNNNPLRLEDFESDWHCRMLATWGHIQDFCIAGIIDFLSDESEWQGRVIANGFAAYQWGNSNTYIDNVRTLTANALNILAPGSETEDIVDVECFNGVPLGTNVVYTIMGQAVAVEDMQPGVLYIHDGKKIMIP